MKKLVTMIVAALSLLLFSGAAATLWQFKDALQVQAMSFEEQRQRFEPHTDIYLPERTGPVPAILFFHGCGGLGKTPGPRTREALKQGYAAVLLDSLTPRGSDSRRVCDGKELHGAERAADVFVALEIARDHPRIDSQKLFLAGFSHGAWAVLEALGYDEDLPPSLSSSPGRHLDGVLAAVAWYPYCGFPARFTDGWEPDIPVLMPLAALDETTDPGPCEAVSVLQAERGKPVRHITYAGVSHGFDEPADWVKHFDPAIRRQAIDAQYAFFQAILPPGGREG